MFSKMYSNPTQTCAKRNQFLLHCGRNRTETGKAIGQPEPSQLLHTDQRCLQDFSEVETLIQDLAGKAVITNVGGMATFPAAASEHIARKGRA